MISGGRTAQVKATDVSVGRQLLCKEKPGARLRSQCAKKLAQTVKAAKTGLTPAQQKLWRQMVYTPAALLASRHCMVSKPRTLGSDWAPARSVSGSDCAKMIFNGSLKFKSLFGGEYKWTDFLKKGAELIKKIPTLRCKPPLVPYEGNCVPKVPERID